MDPIGEERDAEDRNHAAEQCPCGWKPGLEHPAEGGAHEGVDDEESIPGITLGIAEEDFAGSEDEALRGEIHRHVGGLHGDLDAFKVRPHGWGGVGEAAMGEGVCSEQEAEVVLHEGQGDGADGQDGEAEEQGGGADGCDGEMASTGEAMKGTDEWGKGG